MMKALGISILIILLCSFHLQGQKKGYKKGYVVLEGGAKLKGAIKDRKSGRFPEIYDAIKFKPRKGKTCKFDADDLYEYQRSETIFRSVLLQEADETEQAGEQRVFMKVVNEGYLSLYHYEFIDYDGDRSIRYICYLKRADERLFTRVTKKGFKDKMIGYLKDDPEVVGLIDSKDYQFEDLSEIVDHYNYNADD